MTEETFAKSLPAAPEGYHWLVGEGTRDSYGFPVSTVRVSLMETVKVKRWFGRGHKDRVVTAYTEQIDVGDFRDLGVKQQKDRLIAMAYTILERKGKNDTYEAVRNAVFGEYR